MVKGGCEPKTFSIGEGMRGADRNWRERRCTEMMKRSISGVTKKQDVGGAKQWGASPKSGLLPMKGARQEGGGVLEGPNGGRG